MSEFKEEKTKKKKKKKKKKNQKLPAKKNIQVQLVNVFFSF